nr:MAG TPA: hypothetical protein [Caudoviricetes sp.]
MSINFLLFLYNYLAYSVNYGIFIVEVKFVIVMRK